MEKGRTRDKLNQLGEKILQVFYYVNDIYIFSLFSFVSPARRVVKRSRNASEMSVSLEELFRISQDGPRPLLFFPWNTLRLVSSRLVSSRVEESSITARRESPTPLPAMIKEQCITVSSWLSRQIKY